LRLPPPDEPLRCLLVQVRFSAFSFWNFVAACETMGASTPSPPLGLLTVAALLPQHWQFRLLDLNTRPFSEEDWAWADLVCVGGMLPQQAGMLAVIERARRDGKFVAVGGSDPTSQPDVYAAADARVLGEGESAIPVWLESWRAGEPRGVFREREKPDVTRTPVPRYDLLNFGCYAQIGVQYSRGCPFNCEFCDIIELFGRVPRTKTAEQLLGELDRLRELGYSGAVDIVDDNFIGNKRDVKRLLLPALIAWSERHGRPFFFTTEASMNLADDDELLGLMRAAGFRLVFMGIETPDPDLLRMTQKRQNTMRPIVERVRKLYDYGIVVTGGFIMGFDGEKRGADRAMVGLVEESGICLAMVGLLVALPTTQLTRRLVREGRLMDFTGKVVSTEAEAASSARAEGSMVEVVDQTLAGLNFVTTRDRLEIFEEYESVVRTLYDPQVYFDRVLRTGLALGSSVPRWPSLWELRRNLLGFWRVSLALSADPETRWRYWRNVLRLALRGPMVLEQMMRMMGFYVHIRDQTRYLYAALGRQKASQAALPDELRAVAPRAAALAPGD
jgi:radical SAM superfamily enzyme YgiQ (UPF0313 family)